MPNTPKQKNKLKIGLVAYKKGELSPYKVLYKWEEVERHNKSKNAVQIPKELWNVIQLLKLNKLLLKDIQDFQNKYGYAETEKNKMELAVNPKKNKRYTVIKNELMLHSLKRQMTQLGKDTGGKYLFLLFYAGVLDTYPNNLREWFHPNFTISHNYLNPCVSINIHNGDISKNGLIKYIKDNWKEIEERLPDLYKKAKYNVSKRDLFIVRSKNKNTTDDDIMYKVANKFKDQEEIDPQAVKVARLRTQKKIDELYKRPKYITDKKRNRTTKNKKK